MIDSCAFADAHETGPSIARANAEGSNGTINQMADFLTTGFWANLSGYRGDGRSFDTGAGAQITVNMNGLSASEQFLTRAALESWEMVADINFRETSGSADIAFEIATSGSYATTNLTGDTLLSATVNIDDGLLERYGATLDGYAFQTIMHEIGHALGLGHLGDYDGGADYSEATFINDSWSVSVMSYFNQNENTRDDASYARLATTMIADIAAIQDLYGTPGAGSVTAGDTIYGADSNLGNYLGDMFQLMSLGRTTGTYDGDPVSMTIWDAGGIDTLDYSFTTSNNTIRLYETGQSNVDGGTGNLTIAQGTLIENASSGSGHDTMQGNYANNTLRAGAGSDVVGGGNGNDALFGEDGNDTIYGGMGNDTAYGGNGWDELWAGGGNDVVLGGNGNDMIGGGTGADIIYSGVGSDTVYASGGSDIVGGFVGNDQLFGSGGNDTIYGGIGNDTVYGGDGDDAMGAGDGTDELLGGSGNDIIYGGRGDDTVLGGAGNDTISAGQGDDMISGGAGADQFYFGAGDDTLTDFDSGDTINFSYVSEIANFDDLMNNHIRDTDSGVLVEAGDGVTLLLENTTIASLDQGDFVF
ncbi:M10 family metallopeptidase [Sulfitobacter sp. SK012]|uniref:M10 family metallopeptidase n=1 Tax=Sulfitobacter sp. SK012 TaxID=1389005 RepID=UPI0013B43E5B|nr:M10 family metallopeptidase [Sulfitobacter sp. SK012]